MAGGYGSAITLVVGLGNPGKEYEGTRHNVGFEVIDRLTPCLKGSFKESSRFSSIYWQGRFRSRTLYIQKPMTYMNLSGKAVSALMRKNGITHLNCCWSMTTWTCHLEK